MGLSVFWVMALAHHWYCWRIQEIARAVRQAASLSPSRLANYWVNGRARDKLAACRTWVEFASSITTGRIREGVGQCITHLRWGSKSEW